MCHLCLSLVMCQPMMSGALKNLLCTHIIARELNRPFWFSLLHHSPVPISHSSLVMDSELPCMQDDHGYFAEHVAKYLLSGCLSALNCAYGTFCPCLFICHLSIPVMPSPAVDTYLG